MMKNQFSKKMTAAALAGGLAFFGFSSSLQAQLKIGESFDYAAGTFNLHNVNTSAGGTGWGGTQWDNTGQKNGYGSIINPGLSYGSLPVAGNAAGDGHGRYWGASFRKFGSTLLAAGLLDDGAEMWFSVVIEGSANGTTSKLGFSIGNGSFGSSDWNLTGPGGGEGLGFLGYNTGDATAMGWTGGGTDGPDSGSAVDGTPGPTLVVGHVQWGVGAADETLTLYAPDATLTMGAAVQGNNIANVNQITFDRVALLYKDGQKIDEIRIGATYNDVVGIVGCPASANNYGAGLAGLNGIPTLAASAAPKVATSISVTMSNASGASASAMLVIGVSPAAAPLLGGTLLVNPLILFGLPLPAAGTFIPWNNIPANPACNSIYLQLLHLDTGAIHGLAMSPGLKLDVGY
jgi:hypothetical protein